eukprot:13760563-Heterocapsa_arctica.AAC.1
MDGRLVARSPLCDRRASGGDRAGPGPEWTLLPTAWARFRRVRKGSRTLARLGGREPGGAATTSCGSTATRR